jgi:hypothetical protein
VPSSPGLILVVLLALIATSLTRLVVPRGPYLWTLAVSGIGVAVGELVAASGPVAGPALGAAHPVVDAVVVVALQAAGTLLVPAPPRRN